MTSESRFPATVVKVLERDRVALNRGTTHGVRIGQRFVIYALDQEVIRDPSTGEELGRLELAKGYGVIAHVQENLSILYNDKGDFNAPRVGDLAKPV
jgi:hypothetical protein